MKSWFKNEVGKVYGRLTVLERANNDKYGNATWKCLCKCGGIKITTGHALRSGQCKSCGCIGGGFERKGGALFVKAFSGYRNNAVKKGIIFLLTLEDFKNFMQQACFYCGRNPFSRRYAYHRTRYSKGIDTDESKMLNGVDRVNPQSGYVKGNCVPCCRICNRAKSDLSQSEFKELVCLIYKNFAGEKDGKKIGFNSEN